VTEAGGSGPNAANDNAVEVRNLTKRFGTFTAVDGISFSVRRGEICGLLGANGAGKTTTIRMLCALMLPTSGRARVLGHGIESNPQRIKQSIGYMSQRFSLYQDLTVLENIRFFGGVYGLTPRQIRSRLDWVLELAGLKGHERRLTATLSTGWKQRLALGCAVLHGPGMVFLDEPTSGVDPASRRNFWKLINKLASEGMTIMVTTHYMDEAEYCNTILLMNAGRLIAQGSPGELKRRAVGGAVYSVECEGPTGALRLLRGRGWVDRVSLFGTYLHVSVSADAARGVEQMICRFLEDHGHAVRRIRRIIPGLEDVFLELVEGNQETADG